MEILVFLFVISNVNLVLTNENGSGDVNVTYKVHPEPEDIPQSDQVAESTHSFAVNYGKINPNEHGSQNQIQIPHEKLNDLRARYPYDGEQNIQQVTQQEIPPQEHLRHDGAALNNAEILQPSLPEGYNHETQQIYLQQYPYTSVPIRIVGAEASPLHQMRDNGYKTLGYSSYVEHVTEKDEEEIKSALKEGAVTDIKRLVPKSGISFQIYQNDQNVDSNMGNQKTETHLHSKVQKNYLLNSNLQGFRNKPDVPATKFKIQTLHQEHQQPTVGLEESHQTYLKTEIDEQQRGHEIRQDLLQPVDATSNSQDEQGGLGLSQHYSLPFNLNSQKSILETSDTGIFPVKQSFKINVEDNNYNKRTTETEFNSLNANRGLKNSLSDVGNLQYQKQWSSDIKSEGFQKAIKNVKRPPAVEYDRSLLLETERIKKLHYTQNHELDVQNNINKHKTEKSIKNNANVNYFSNAYVGRENRNGFVEHLANKAYLDKDTAYSIINRLSENYLNPENMKTGENHALGYLRTNAYANSQVFKDSHRERFPTNSHSDSETAKSSQHNLISPLPKNSFIETKNSQNNFDHQKALEGSTSFDIKNAIDNTGNLIHQASPTAETHSLEDIQRQQLAYVVPKIPASTVLIDNSIHETPTVAGHQIKDFGQAVLTSPHLSYQTVSSSGITGKFSHQPQTVVWTSDHLKHGNALAPNDLHRPLLRLHLPKEEIYKFVETPNVELPTSSVSHVSYPQQKQPFVLHYDVPLIKYPQEIHFQPKTKTRIQNGQTSHIKLVQPVSVDWSLFKSTLPNYNLNSLALKPEVTSHVLETGKKIVPILVRKRKNRSNNKQEIGIVYGKVNSNRKPMKPNHRQEKNVRVNLLPEVTNKNQFDANVDRKNEFSVSASYTVDRSLKSSGNP